VTPALAASIAEYLQLSRPHLHVRVTDDPLPTVYVSRTPDGPPVVFAFDGCVYGAPRTDGSTAIVSGYEAIDPDARTITDPIAGPFDLDDPVEGLRLLAAMLQAVPG
jgi:hypothetical protein